MRSGLITATLSNNTIISNTAGAIGWNYSSGSGLPQVSGNTIAGNGFDGLLLGGNPVISMTWPMTFAVPVGVGEDMSFYGGRDLFVPPGAVVRVAERAGLSGVLHAIGTPTQPITFTSIAITPTFGWGGLDLSSGSALEYVTVINAGGAGAYQDCAIGVGAMSMALSHITVSGNPGSGLCPTNSQLTVTGSTFSGNGRAGIYASGGTLTVTGSTITGNTWTGIYAPLGAGAVLSLTGNTFSGNMSAGIIADLSSGAAMTVTGNTISGNMSDGINATVATGAVMSVTANTVSTNGQDGINVGRRGGIASVAISNNTIVSNTVGAVSWWYDGTDGSTGLPVLTGNTVSANGFDAVLVGGTLGFPMTWPLTFELPLIIVREMFLFPGVELTIQPGSEVRFWSMDSFDRAGITENGGALRAQGTPSHPITFTSASPSPAPGQWGSIILNGDYNSLQYVTASGGAGIVVEGGLTSIFHLTSVHNERGLSIGSAVSVAVDQCVLENNGTGLHILPRSGPVMNSITMSNCSISHNSDDGILLVGWGTALDASFDLCSIEDNGGNGVSAHNEETRAVNVALSRSTIAGNGADGVHAQAGHPINVTLNECTATHNGSDGVYHSSQGSTQISASTLRDNGEWGVRAGAGTLVEDCTITGNGAGGLATWYAGGGPPTYARYNWWGDPSGPYNAATNPHGLGNSVSNNVLYEPWQITSGPRQPVPLALGQTLTDSITPFGVNDYQLAVTGGQPILVQVTPLAGSPGLWVYGRMTDAPSWTQYDLLTQSPAASGAYELMVLPTYDGTYIVRVYGRNVTGGAGSYRITARAVDRGLSDVSPRTAGNAGEATLSLTGMPFSDGMAVQLPRCRPPNHRPRSVPSSHQRPAYGRASS